MKTDKALIKNTKWERRQKKSFQEAHTPLDTAVKTGEEKGYDYNSFTQDLFSALYQVKPEFPEEVTTPGKQWHKQALDTMKDLREYTDMRTTGTICDSFQSGLGSTVIAEKFLEQLEERKDPDDIQDKIDAWQDFVNEFPDHEAAKKAKKTIKRMQESLENAIQQADGQKFDDQKMRMAMRSALTAAKQEIDSLDGAASAYGFGTEPGTDGYTSAEDKIAVAKHIKDNPKLKEIAELAGRFRREARTVQSNKKVPGHDELSDIETGADLGRLIPAELMKLNNKYLKLEFARKMLERNLMQYKLESVEKKDRGPIIVCIDNSGSMRGAREVWSKAIALAMCQIAIDQKRAVEIIHFDNDVRRKDVFEPGKVDHTKLIESMLYFSGGGTNFGPPLGEAFRDIIEANENGLGDADVIFITDGLAELSEKQKDIVYIAKEAAGASLYAMQLDDRRTGALAAISDEVFLIADLYADNTHLKDTIFSV